MFKNKKTVLSEGVEKKFFCNAQTTPFFLQRKTGFRSGSNITNATRPLHHELESRVLGPIFGSDSELASSLNGAGLCLS